MYKGYLYRITAPLISLHFVYYIVAFPEKNESVLPYVLIQQNSSVQPKETHIPFNKIYTHIPFPTVSCVINYLYYS